MAPEPRNKDPLPPPVPDHRPEVLPLFTVTLIIGMQLAATFPGVGGWFFLVAGIGFFVLGFMVPFRGLLAWAPLIVGGICLGGVIQAARAEDPVPPEAFQKLQHLAGTMEGTFIGEFKYLKRGGVSFLADQVVLNVASQVVKLPSQARFEVRSLDLIPEPGQRYLATGTLQIVKGKHRPNFIAEGIVPAENSGWINPLVGGIQRWVRDGTSTLLSQRNHAMMVGFLLGDTSLIDRADRQLFRATGLSHLLAVSGQHIMILAVIIISVFVWVGIPPMSRCFLTVLTLGLFCLVTGGQPSVWRALVMYTSGVVILHLEADPGPIRPLAFAALLLLLYRPEWVSNIGFQLSFLAVLGILLAQPPLEALFCRAGIPEVLSRYLAVSFAANFATIPISAYYFGFIPLVSFVVNPLVVWSFGLILPMGIALAGLGHMWFNGGVILASALSFLLDSFLWIVEKCSHLPFANIEMFPMPGFMVAAFYGFMLFSLGLLSLEKKGTRLAAAVVKAKKKKPLSEPPVKTASPNLPPGMVLKKVWEHTLPLKDVSLLEVVDAQLSRFPKRSLKSRGHFEMVSFPLKKLTVENQTLFYRLDDLSRELLRNEPDRLLQAQVFVLAFLAGEILGKICPRLTPPPAPGELTGTLRARNRYLATALAAEVFFQSALSSRSSDPFILSFIKRAQILHQQGNILLSRFVRERSLNGVADHLSHRQAVFEWVREVLRSQEGNLKE